MFLLKTCDLEDEGFCKNPKLQLQRSANHNMMLFQAQTPGSGICKVGRERWMDVCPVFEKDGGRNQGKLLARLVIVYSRAIDARDNHTLSPRNVETPTDTFRGIQDADSGRTSPYQH